MAITKILPRNSGLKAAIEYVLNGEKTDGQVLTARLNCVPGYEYREMMDIKSFKSKKLTRNPSSEWICVENTHEPIISKDVFDQVQQQIASRRREQDNRTVHIFAGLVKCADCGWTMRFSRQSKGARAPYFMCGKYSERVRQCTSHFIRYDALYAYVLDRLRFWSGMAWRDECGLLERLLESSDQGRAVERKKRQAELKKAEKRRGTVNDLFVRMYEDWTAGRITESNFRLLSERYQAEQAELDEKIASLKSDMENTRQSAENAEKWVGLIRQYSDITELDAPVLNTLIEKIVVHEGVKLPSGDREQEVEIYTASSGKSIFEGIPFYLFNCG